MELFKTIEINPTSLNVASVTKVALSIILSYIALQILYALLQSPQRDIPGAFLARFTRLWELFQVIKGNFHETIVKLHEQHGPVVRLGPNKFSFNAQEHQKIIYSLDEYFEKTSYYKTGEDPSRPNIFSMRDETKHADHKKRIANLYSMSSMVHYEDAVDRMNALLLQKFGEFAERQKEVMIPGFMQCYAFDVIGEITINRNFGMVEKEGDVDDMIKTVQAVIMHQGTVGIVPELHRPIHALGRILGSKNAVVSERLSCSLIEKHRDKNVVQGKCRAMPFVTKLVKLESEGKIDFEHMMDAMGANIGAGSDTTAITLSAALYYVYRTPDVLRALRKETDDLATDGKITDPVSFKEAQNMPYLQAVIMETLRIHPAVGYILPRKVPKGGVELSGRWFPEGTEVGVSAWALHRNPEIYGDDAHEFRPGRFLNTESKNFTAQLGGSFAFGAGARTCLGKNISLLELTKVLPQIVRRFDLVFADDKPWELFTTWFVWQKYYCYIERRKC